MLPLARPAMMTLAILTFLYAWNDYLWPLVSAQEPERFTITLGLASDPIELRAIGRAGPRHGLGRHRLPARRDPVPDLPALRGPGHDGGGSKG
jgi:hypothetical protein